MSEQHAADFPDPGDRRRARNPDKPPAPGKKPPAPPRTARRPTPAELLRRARVAVSDLNAPTWGMDLRANADGVERARARAAIDLAMRIAESTLSTGASSADVTANILDVTRAYGLRSVHVDVTFTSIAVTHHRGAFEDPVTMVRTVRVRTPDYQRLAETHTLINAITQENVSLDDARQRFQEIMERPRIYRRSIVTLALVLLAAGVCALMGGMLLEIGLAMVIVALVDRVSLWTAHRQLAAFFGQIVGGAIPTVVAMTLVALRPYLPPVFEEFRPSVLVATGIIVLLAGLAVVGAAQDAIDGYYVTAAGRTFEVVVLTLGIVVGVLAVITFAFRLGVPSHLVPPATLASSLAVQIVAVVAIAAGFALSGYAGLRTIAVSAVLAVAGWLVYVLFLRFEFQSVVATAFACVVVGFLAQPSATKFRVPSFAIATAGIVAFLPGMMVYRGLYYLVEPDLATTAGTTGPDLLWGAAATGLAIAAGTSLGSFIGRSASGSDRAGAMAKSRVLERASTDARE